MSTCCYHHQPAALRVVPKPSNTHYRHSVTLNTLWSPDTRPVHLLPYLTRRFPLTADRKSGRKETKRQVISDVMADTPTIKGPSAHCEAIEPLGYPIEVKEVGVRRENRGTFTALKSE